MASLGTDLAGKSTEFIAQQVEAEAQRRSNQQQMEFQDQLNRQNAIFQQQMLAAYQQPIPGTSGRRPCRPS
jgi:hypothetical protein